MKRATTANEHVSALDTELASDKAVHICLVGVSTQAEEDVKEACSELQIFQVRHSETVREDKVDSKRLEDG